MLNLRYFYSVPPEIVFEAWTQPQIMKRWLFKSDSNEIINIDIDKRIGGKFSILERNNGEKIDHFGEFKEIKEPNRLEFTLEVPWHFEGISYVSIQIDPTHAGSELFFSQKNIDTSKTKNSWHMMLENLKNIFKKIDKNQN